ncbi:hypothetical protein [Aureivirga sp. CE67]|uniref:hypothetical protein n=1 Tax=Aureivirga sp. CE67 TaxID=1788983 RepID=UPI0018C98ACA|nr:hypothetical protein [Aureivirga sp. CE67]
MNGKLTLLLRILLSSILIFLGFNHFFHLLSEEIFNLELLNIFNLNYFADVISIMQIIGGGLILTKKWQVLALIMLMPLSFNVLFFYLKLDPNTLGLEAIVAILNILFVYHNWNKIQTFFKRKLSLKNL